MITMRAARAIVKRRADGCNEVITIELPIRVLKSMFHRVGMVEKDAADGPIREIFRTGQRECVADAGRMSGFLVALGNNCG